MKFNIIYKILCECVRVCMSNNNNNFLCMKDKIKILYQKIVVILVGCGLNYYYYFLGVSI